MYLKDNEFFLDFKILENILNKYMFEQFDKVTICSIDEEFRDLFYSLKIKGIAILVDRNLSTNNEIILNIYEYNRLSNNKISSVNCLFTENGIYFKIGGK